MKNSLYHRTIKLLENEHLDINLESASLIYPKLLKEKDCDGNCNDINCSCSKFSKDRRNFYLQSGLKFIFNNLIEKKHIKDNLRFAFIENSNLPSAILEPELDAFSMTWENNNESSFQNAVSTYFKPIIKALQESGNALFWHKDFFQEPHSGQAILTFNHHKDKTRFHNRLILLDSLKNSLDKLNKNKATINLKTDYFECFDDEKITNIYTTLGNIEFDYEKFKELISENEISIPPTVLHSLNHHLYDIFFRNDSLKDDLLELELKETIEYIKKYYDIEKNILDVELDINTVFLSIPILCANPLATIDGEATLIGFGALFVYLGFKESQDNLLIIDELQDFATNITTHIRSFSQGYVFNINNRQQKIIESNATRAAISQVMARNMSHNIGSHVLSRLITKNEIDQILTDKKQCKNLLINHKEDTLIPVFNSYLKTRMDYLADITSCTPVIENIKGFYNEIITGFLQNRILLDRISGISDFEYEIFVCHPKDKSVCNGIKCNKDCPSIISQPYQDIQVSIPNDVLGCQAIYVIFENIIRNTAKHGTKKSIEFYVRIEDIEESDELYMVSVIDNSPIVGKDKLNETERQYYSKILGENIKSITKIKRIVVDQNNRLNESILTSSDKKLRQGSWGLIEMDASAAYLRKIAIEEIDSEKYNIDLRDEKNIYPSELTEKKKKEKNEEKQINIMKAYSEHDKYLGYRFFVNKPREILIIGEDNILFEEEFLNDSKKLGLKKNELQKIGIWIIKDVEEKKVYPERLVIDLRNNLVSNTNKLENTRFTKRIYKPDSYKSNDIKNIISEYIANNEVDRDKTILEKFWANYFENINAELYYQPFFDNTQDDFIRNILNKSKLNKNIKSSFYKHGVGYNTVIDGFEFVEIWTSATKQFFNLNYHERLKSWFSEPEKIMVIDERIQEFAEKESYFPESEKNSKKSDPINYKLIYKKTNILIPETPEKNEVRSINCNLNEQNFYDNFLEIINYIQKGEANFYVIHLGIIEKLINAFNNSEINQINFSKEKEGIKKFIENVICKRDGNIIINYSNIIITSGRGVPHNLPDDIRYLNFSIISQYLIDTRNKYAFTEAIYSARRIMSN